MSFACILVCRLDNTRRIRCHNNDYFFYRNWYFEYNLQIWKSDRFSIWQLPQNKSATHHREGMAIRINQIKTASNDLCTFSLRWNWRNTDRWTLITQYTISSTCMWGTPCWSSRSWRGSHQGWISRNLHRICLCQVQIRLPTLALKPRGDATRKSKTGISVVPRKGIMSSKNSVDIKNRKLTVNIFQS